MRIEEVVAKSWEHLQGALFDGWFDNDGLGKYRSPYYFRGLDDAEYPLSTTLQRLGGNFAEIEDNLVRNFRKYAHQDIDVRSHWHWLALGQHHGLPTRLLDWTASPLVALHFAVGNPDRFSRPGVVWAADFSRAHSTVAPPLKEILRKSNAKVFIVEMIESVAENLNRFDALARTEFLLFFEPPNLDARISNQYALFSVMNSAKASVDSWLRQHGAVRRFIIPSVLKWEIRDKLDNANLNERMLFPGPSGLAAWLRRYYTPRAVKKPN